MKHIVWMAVGMTGVMLAGCRTAPDPAQQDVLAQLKEINASLREIARNMPDTGNSALNRVSISDRGDGTRGPDLAVLANVKALPDKPTDDDIRRYLGDIQKAAAGQNCFAPSDPQVEMLKMIGPGHFKVLEPYLNGRFYHLQYALPSLVADGDKEAVCAMLPQCPALVEVVTAKGWTAEVKPQIFELAKYTNEGYQLQSALATYVNTPEDRQKLIDLYVSRPSLGTLFDTIKTFPGVDLGALTTQAWKNPANQGQDWYRIIAAARAAAYGNKEALEQVILAQVGEGANTGLFGNQEAGQLLVQATRQMPNPEAMLKWYNENADKLVFDKNKGCWVVK